MSLPEMSLEQHLHFMKLGYSMGLAETGLAGGLRQSGTSITTQTPPLFTPSECSILIERFRGKTREGLVADPAKPNAGIVDPSRYIARDVLFDPTVPDLCWLLRRLAPHITAAGKQRSLPDLKLTEAARLVLYGPGGHFNWHPDAIGSVGRQMTVSVQLSPPDSYTGGDLLVLGKQGQWSSANREQGAACLFPAELFHRVMPIAQGQRAALVFWLY